MTNILVVEDTNWIERGPHQQHHIFERIGRRNNLIYVVDFDLLWEKKQINNIIIKRKIFRNFFQVIKNSNITVYRPSILRIPILDKLFILIYNTYLMNKIIKRNNIQIIIGHSILSTLSGIFLSKLYRIPFIYHLVDSQYSLASDYIPKPLLIFAKIIEIINIKLSDKIITVNKGLKDYIKIMGGKQKSIYVIPAGVNLNNYKEEKNRNKIRKQLNINNGDLVLFFLGWLYNFSGLKELANYIFENPNFRIKLLAVGDGDLFDYLLDLSKRSKNIIVTGRIPFNDVPDYLSAADICILPAYNNKIMRHIVPIKLYEYMAAKKPIIATKLPGLIREFGINNGILYSNNVEELIELALKISKENKLSLLGQKCYNIIKDRSWDILVDKFEKIINCTIKEWKYKS